MNNKNNKRNKNHDANDIVILNSAKEVMFSSMLVYWLVGLRKENYLTNFRKNRWKGLRND